MEPSEGEDCVESKENGDKVEATPEATDDQPNSASVVAEQAEDKSADDDGDKSNDDDDDSLKSLGGEVDGGDQEDEERAEDDDNDDDHDDDDDDNQDEDENDDDNASLGTTQTAGSHTQDEADNGSREAMHKSISSHLPDHLDEDTLEGIKSYLKDFQVRTPLDEDEIAMLMVKADRNVEQRARYNANPLDEEVDEELLQKDLYKEEEEYLVGHDFMKEMAAKLNENRKRGANVDKKTLNWVKRAAGLNRKDYHTPHSAMRDDGESDEGGVKKVVPRRYTRGMARTTRIKKKEEFIFKDTLGIKSLLKAIEDMEPESGPYPVPFECIKNKEKPRHSSERRRPAQQTIRAPSDDESSKRSSKRRDPPSGPMIVPLVVRIPEKDFLEGYERNPDYIFGENRDILLTRIVVNGEHVDEGPIDSTTLRERKRELKRLRDRQYQKRKRDRRIREKERRQGKSISDSKYTTPIRSNTKRRRQRGSDEDQGDRRKRRKKDKSSSHTGSSLSLSGRSFKGPVSLALLDWQRRQMWSPGRKARKFESEREIRQKVEIPPHLARYGVGFRLPPWESVNPASDISDQSNQFAPPRGRHSDEVYAAWCHKLINCLNGSARSWALHEFFYSDIDRAWYNSNTFGRDVAKLGILPTAKLTRREWSAVRRLIPNRPRRFSKRFIFTQLKERNKYRNIVRELHRNPDQTNHTGYEIPAPIRVGSTVTAYNKKFLILHRGVVLFHDIYAAQYLIQFERKEAGFEFCSDTEVASHGVPEMLMPPSPSILTGSPTGYDILNSPDIGALPYGTSFGPLSGKSGA
jgi:hypothetical protein